MSRSLIVEKLRRLARPEQAGPMPSSLPDFPCYSDPAGQFQAELERVSGVFIDGRTPEALRQGLERILTETRAEEIYWESEELFGKHQVPFRLREPEAFERRHLVFSEHKLRQVVFPLLLFSRPYSRQTLATLAVSASSAAAGVAETGTVVERAGKAIGRLLPVLPPAHVSLLRQRDLLMNQAEFFSALQPGKESSYQVLVTGPSRTADIEKTLVLGVHGPQRHYVILTV